MEGRCSIVIARLQTEQMVPSDAADGGLVKPGIRASLNCQIVSLLAWLVCPEAHNRPTHKAHTKVDSSSTKRWASLWEKLRPGRLVRSPCGWRRLVFLLNPCNVVLSTR